MNKRQLFLTAVTFALCAAGCSGNTDASKTSTESSVVSSTASTESSVKKEESSASVQDSETSGSISEETGSSAEAKTKTIGDFEVTLKSASQMNASGAFTPEAGNTYIAAVFEIKNNSDEAVEISSGTNFEAYADGEAIYQAWMVEPEGVEWIDGIAEPGQTVEGCVCFEAPEDFSEITLSFIPDILEADTVSFQIHK